MPESNSKSLVRIILYLMFKGFGLQSHYRSVWGTYKLRRVKFMVSGVYRNKPRPFIPLGSVQTSA